jgi:hypothetical protein
MPAAKQPNDGNGVVLESATASSSEQTVTKPKHVIILGAGASASSGYPVGNDLRLSMSSTKALEDRIRKALENAGDVDRLGIVKQFHQWIKPLEKALKLFREGNFATVDEFCRLAGRKGKGVNP